MLVQEGKQHSRDNGIPEMMGQWHPRTNGIPSSQSDRSSPEMNRRPDKLCVLSEPASTIPISANLDQ